MDLTVGLVLANQKSEGLAGLTIWANLLSFLCQLLALGAGSSLHFQNEASCSFFWLFSDFFDDYYMVRLGFQFGLVSQYFSYSLVLIFSAQFSSLTWLFSDKYSDNFYVSSLMQIFSYLDFWLLCGILDYCCLISLEGCRRFTEGCSLSSDVRSLESKEWMDADCLPTDYLQCLQLVFCALLLTVLGEMSGSAFVSLVGISMQVLLSLSLFLMILPMLFLLDNLGSGSLAFSSFFQSSSSTCRLAQLKVQGSVFMVSISMTLVLEGQLTLISLLLLASLLALLSLPALIFSPRLFLGVVFGTGFLDGLGLDLGSEAAIFLLECGLSGLMTIQNLIFLALLPGSSRLTTIFWWRSAFPRPSLPLFSLISSTCSGSLTLLPLLSCVSSLY